MTKKMQFNTETATEYDRGIRRTLPSYDAMFRIVHAHLRYAINSTSEVLIIGAGGGTELAVLGPANKDWQFTAVDPSRPMLALAKEKVEQCALSERVQFIEGTVNLVEAQRQFDAATCMLVLHFIEDDAVKLQQLKAIRKRLKKGAPFIISAMYGDVESEEFERLFQLWKAYWADTTSLSTEEIDEMSNTIRNLSFLPEEKILHLLQTAGFGNITHFFKTNIFGGWICEAID